ncbi:EAL domain-containing protein [Salidesulfovibrio brasiliensis]
MEGGFPDVRKILESDSVRTLFQPIVSISRRTVFAVEALSRGFDPETHETVPPALLFGNAGGTLRRDLDRLCRERALETFSPVHKQNPALIMSMNVDVSTLEESTSGNHALMKTARAAGIQPHNVIIELVESAATNLPALLHFVNYYRRRGFIIALDDVGAGHSNLDRIPLLKPDVLKLDRSLISGVHNHFHKLEVVRCLVRLAARIGALVVAEGVETPEEALCVLDCGIDLHQGFLYAVPETPSPTYRSALRMVDEVASGHQARSTRRVSGEYERSAARDAVMLSLCMRLSDASLETLDVELARCIDEGPDLECLYVLDMRGKQVSGTICDPAVLMRSRRILYAPAEAGADHSLKDYYIPIRAGLRHFVTRPYISLASGNRCMTHVRVFRHDPTGSDLILCADMAAGSNDSGCCNEF